MWPVCKTVQIFLQCRIIGTANKVNTFRWVQLILRISQTIWLHAPVCTARVQRRAQASLCALIEDHFYYEAVPSLQCKSAKAQKAERLDKSFYHTRGVSCNESCSLFHRGFIILGTGFQISASINVMILFCLPGLAERWSEWKEKDFIIHAHITCTSSLSGISQ